MNQILSENPTGSTSRTNVGPGILYIFNHKNFDEYNKLCHDKRNQLAVRDGTECDVKALQLTFEYFDVQNILFNDLKLEEIEEKITEISTKNFSNNSCIIIAILTHGFSNNILAASDKMYNFNDIVLKIFTNKYMKAKPKIFLLQACRGDINILNFNARNLKTDGTTLCTEQLPYYNCDEKYELRSATDEFVAYRDEKLGSPFIQIFCEFLYKLGYYKPISELFPLVMIEVQKVTGCSQMPEITTNAIKQYVFGDYCQGAEAVAALLGINDGPSRTKIIDESEESSEERLPYRDYMPKGQTIYVGEQCRRSVTTASGTAVNGGSYCSGQKIFEDNFNSLDENNWEHEITLAGGGNWEFQWYTNNRDNSFIKDDKLHIRPTLTSDIYGESFLSSGTIDLNQGSSDRCTLSEFWGCKRTGTSTHILNPIRSARLRTKNSFNFKYGRVVIRAKLPAGDWLWPAISLLPKTNAYGGWPMYGEIDIMEGRGNRNLRVNGVNIGTEQIGSTLHFGPNPQTNGFNNAHFEKSSSAGHGFDKDFHDYEIIWTPHHIKFKLDDSEIGTVHADEGFFKKGHFPTNIENPWKGATKMAPFDQEFHLILNLAVGGVNGYFPDNGENTNPKPWPNNSTNAATDFWNGRSSWLPTWNLNDKNNIDADFIVDYIRVYAL